VSDVTRDIIVASYNTRRNNPYKETMHPRYTPLDRWGDDSIMDLGASGVQEGDGTEFLDWSKAEKFIIDGEEKRKAKEAESNA
jgi:hypothetical protein